MKNTVVRRGSTESGMWRGGSSGPLRGTSEEGIPSSVIGNKDLLIKQVPGRALRTLHVPTHFPLTT